MIAGTFTRHEDCLQSVNGQMVKQQPCLTTAFCPSIEAFAKGLQPGRLVVIFYCRRSHTVIFVVGIQFLSRILSERKKYIATDSTKKGNLTKETLYQLSYDGI